MPKEKLEPPDPKRCQAMTREGSFMTFGPREWKRCESKPTVIATEKKPQRGSRKRGSMSMCDSCLTVAKAKMPGMFTIEVIEVKPYDGHPLQAEMVAIHHAMHKAWTAATERIGYDKVAWRDFAGALQGLATHTRDLGGARTRARRANEIADGVDWSEALKRESKAHRERDE